MIWTLTLACTLISALLFIYVVITSSTRFFKEYRSTFQEAADVNMADMFMFIDPAKLFLYNLAALFVLPVVIWILTGDMLIAGFAFTFFLILPPVVYKTMYTNRLKKIESQLPDALVMITGALKAGASLNMALESLVREQPAPISQEMALLVRQQRLGIDFDKALDSMEARVPIQSFYMLVAALKISREIGGNLAETLEILAETLRRKVTMEGKIESLTSQGKMQGIVMTGLPVLLAVMLSFIEPENMAKLYTTPAGWVVLGVIIVMEVLGYIFINKITSIDV
ncbi:MAG: type II secretion system F family protein [Gammaproteobacteria bacterium]|nr:type II secretion system F family protein [Gammaproteobacteria bacterium]